MALKFDLRPPEPRADEEDQAIEPDLLEITWSGETRTIIKPTAGMLMVTGDRMAAAGIDITGIIWLFRQIMDDDMVEDVMGLLANPLVPDSDEKVRDLFGSIIRTASGGSPSGSSSASSNSRGRAGQTSTGSKRRPAGTRSTSSRSHASSTSSAGGSSAE